MTDAEWLTCADPTPMLEFLRDKASNRKLILLMVNALRRCRSDLGRKREEMREESIRLELAERYADGHMPVSRVREVWGGVPSYPETPYAWAESLIRRNGGVGVLLYDFPPPEESSERLRELFGNPFHPVAVNPSWLTSDVLALATGIYEERAFDRLPILADALQDAGCDNTEVLDHCRGPGPHVRGCWMIDLLLGKG